MFLVELPCSSTSSMVTDPALRDDHHDRAVLDVGRRPGSPASWTTASVKSSRTDECVACVDHPLRHDATRPRASARCACALMAISAALLPDRDRHQIGRRVPQLELRLGRVDLGQPLVQFLEVQPPVAVCFLDHGGGTLAVVVGCPMTGRRLLQTHAPKGSAAQVPRSATSRKRPNTPDQVCSSSASYCSASAITSSGSNPRDRSVLRVPAPYPIGSDLGMELDAPAAADPQHLMRTALAGHQQHRIGRQPGDLILMALDRPHGRRQAGEQRIVLGARQQGQLGDTLLRQAVLAHAPHRRTCAPAVARPDRSREPAPGPARSSRAATRARPAATVRSSSASGSIPPPSRISAAWPSALVRDRLAVPGADDDGGEAPLARASRAAGPDRCRDRSR